MNFLKSISLSWKGLSFEVRGFLVLIPLSIFNWSVTPVVPGKPYSNSGKLAGYAIVSLLADWSDLMYPNSRVIVLTNINVEAKNIQFWAKVPKPDMAQFMKEIVVLNCKDNTEMERLLDNIPSNFADAHGFYKGKLIRTNEVDKV